MPKWNFEEKESGNKGTLLSYVDLPLILCKHWDYRESPNT